MCEGDDRLDGGGDDEDSSSYPAPAPYVILLPSNPPSLLLLLRSLYVSLADDYPAPGTGSAALGAREPAPSPWLARAARA